MTESQVTFTHANTARQYIKLYEKMLQRPLIAKNMMDACKADFGQKSNSKPGRAGKNK
jgi:hypothetical protein